MRLRSGWLAGLAAGVLSACGAGLSAGGDPGAGATPGGVKDWNLARAQVAQGVVPSPETLAAEGLFSEHDLPLSAARCDKPLCLNTAQAVRGEEAWVQVGLSSNVDLARFERGPMNFGLILDKSCSMSGDRFEAAKQASHALVEQLRPDDLFSLVAFDDRVETVLSPTPGGDRARLHAAIDRLRVGGSTCIECGLERGAELLGRSHTPSRGDRLILLTDARPNVGATGEGAFTQLLETWAARELFVTVLGVGIDFGQALVRRISAVRGANHHFLATSADVRKAFDDFSLLVTPLAFELSMDLAPADGVALDATFGFPALDGKATAARLAVSTVFLSRNRGALLARLKGPLTPAVPFAGAVLSYEAAGGREVKLVLPSWTPSAGTTREGTWASDSGIFRAIALARFIESAQAASRAWASGDRPQARLLAQQSVDVLEAEAAQGDPEVARELPFAKALAALLAR